MQISELLCRAEYIMRATRRPPSSLSNHLLPPPPPPPRLAPALDEMLQLSASPAYPRQLHFAINLRYRTCDRIRRRSRGTGKLRVGSWQTRLASLPRDTREVNFERKYH